MSDENSIDTEEKTEVVFVSDVEISSEEVSMDKWSSLLIELQEGKQKRLQFESGPYHLGSGEFCGKYIILSDSDVFRHLYYNYPAVKDPGIEGALLNPKDKYTYADNGQELYLDTCKEMDEAPIKSFVSGLLKEVIDLRFYCVSSRGVRAISLALRYNRIVKVLNLTANFLDLDACYHLGDMLAFNYTLVELNLSGCKIGPLGAKRLLNGLNTNRSLRLLNLDKNELTDQGIAYLSTAIFHNIEVQEISLSHNNITGKGLNYLTEVFETFNKLTKIDLSWNSLYAPEGLFNFLTRLGENKVLSELNLSWNSIGGARFGTAIKNILCAPKLRYLNLSNNKFTNEGILNFLPGLTQTKKLVTLDLSYNPMTLENAKKVLHKVKDPHVKIQNLFLDNMFVDSEFLEILSHIKETKSKRNLVVTYAGVVGAFNIMDADMREILLNRAEFLAKKPKKRKVDIVLVAMNLLKNNIEVMPTKDFCYAMQQSCALLDNDLLDEIAAVFSGPRSAKTKTVDIKGLVDYMKRKWPDRKLPDSPLPKPEPPLNSVVEKNQRAKTKKL